MVFTNAKSHGPYLLMTTYEQRNGFGLKTSKALSSPQRTQRMRQSVEASPVLATALPSEASDTGPEELFRFRKDENAYVQHSIGLNSSLLKN
jgi:hypothetical protein